ncbi:MAG: glycosyltransferase [Saprospiraceae bacterium]
MICNGEVLIFIPTLNEVNNIEPLINQIIALGVSADFYIIDDNSTDGTLDIIKKLAAQYEAINYLIRPKKMGIGSAHKMGIQWAVDNNYKYLITMDCDFTHPPEYIPVLLDAKDNADIIIGSRYLKQGSLEGWSVFRKMLTYFGHFLTDRMLNMQYDASSAFRIYNMKLPMHSLCDKVVSESYSFFFESLFILHFNHFKIGEIPIRLPARAAGHSKMSWSDAVRSIRFLLELYMKKIAKKHELKL